MAGRLPTGRKIPIGFRTDKANAEHIAAQAKKHRGITNYLNWLISRDRTGIDDGLHTLEDAIAATLAEVREDIRKSHLSTEAHAALFHAWLKMYLVNTPEADGTAKSVAKTTAERRYQMLLTNAAAHMQDEGDQQ